MLTRRDQRSPSDWLKIVVDSYYDKRSAYEFAVNPAGVKTDRYYFNDGNNDDSWDAVWDVQVQTRRRGLAAPSSASRSRSCASTTPRAGPWASRSSARWPRAHETETWPLLARSANGFVSQFGEVRGLRLARLAEEASS